MTQSLSVTGAIDFRVRVPPALFPKIEVPEANTSQYDAVLNTSDKYASMPGLDELLALMEQSNVDHAIMHAEHEIGDLADELNSIVADCVKQHPDKLTGLGAISLTDFSISRALDQLAAIVDLGFVGVSVQPAFFGMTINEKVLYPIYAKAMELGLIVALHTGVNYTTNKPMSGENPMLIDEIACHFPELSIVASHAGWPWATELAAVMRKHPNVYAEFGGLAPKYVGAANTGWDVMHRFMNSVLSEQILYGTDWPVMDHARTLGEWSELELKPHVLTALTSKNASKLIAKHKAR